jgi:hypothetical protein
VVELVEQGGDYKQVRHLGIDPEQTTLVSVASSERDPPADDVRLADILLHALGSNEGSLDRELMQGLAKPAVCPYLKLYASALLVRRLEHAVGPGAVENAPTADAVTMLPRSWLEATAARLLRSLPEGRRWPDAQCCALLREVQAAIDASSAIASEGAAIY